MISIKIEGIRKGVAVVKVIYLMLFGGLGIIAGSFLNVCMYRMPRNISVVTGNKGRSFCPCCYQNLSWYDMIPLFSYLQLRGRCRYCKHKVSIRYPIVEVGNGLIWLFLGWKFGMTVSTIVYSVLFSILLLLSYVDWNTMEIPDSLQLSILFLGIVTLGQVEFPGLRERMIGSMIVSLPMLLGAIGINGFGMGDVILMGVSGFLIGWKAILLAAFIAIMTGGIQAIFALKQNRSDHYIPFGPYLSLGIMLASIWSDSILAWYLALFI